jgi:hypothetical protein
MTHNLSRRRMLRLAALGALGGALAACGRPPAAQAPTPSQPTAVPATAVPPTAIPPTAIPATTAPTIIPATAAPNAVPATAAPAAGAQAPAASQATLAASMARAVGGFLDGLDGERRAKATYAFADPERTRWHWTTPQGFPRNGLPLSEMTEDQRALAFAALQASLSPAGFRKATDIMSLQADLGRDPLLFFVTVFGDPGGAAPWGWRWEGHHYSRQFTISGEIVTMTPFFLGAQPTLTPSGLRAMPREEDAARAIVTSLDGPLRDQAIFDTRPLTRHVTQNRPAVDPLDPVGVAYEAMPAAQQALVREIIDTYLGTLPAPVAAPIQGRVLAAGLATVRFGWAGFLEPGRPHYYRLQGPTFLLEFDNSRNSGGHIHSVWRDFAEDFGGQLVG